MIPLEYFKGWAKVISFRDLQEALTKLNHINPELLCPHPSNVFRAFRICLYDNLKVVFLGQDPFPQKGIATGILFGNSRDTPENKISPSLEIIKECCIDYTIPHGLIEFDNTLENWAEQGILMLNSALTCKVNEVGSHVMIWRKFIAQLLKNLSARETGIIYVLFGKQAQSFEPYINTKNNHIIKVEHPAYFARVNKSMPNIFKSIDVLLKEKYGETIKWYTEY